MKLVDILGKEKVSAYEAGQLVEKVGQFLQQFEKAIITESEYLTEQGNTLLEQVGAFAGKVRDEYAVIEKLAAETETIGNEQYTRIRDAHEKIRKRIEELPEIKPPSVYGMKDILDIAERCRHYTDEQWARVIDLAKAMGNRNGES